MASKQEWIEKIKSWVPGWFYQERTIEQAVISAIAKVLSDVDIEIENQIAQTFVDKAVGGYLALLGDERGLSRFKGEFDNAFRKRIKSAAIQSNANYPSLIDLINKVLVRGKAIKKEDFEIGLYFSRNSFLNRGEISVDPIKDAFTIVIDRQVHEPYSFVTRESFIGRESYFGQAETSTKVFESLINIVNQNKAFGTVFRIVERTN